MNTTLAAAAAEQRRADLRADAEAYRRARTARASAQSHAPSQASPPATVTLQRHAMRRFWHWLATAQL